METENIATSLGLVHTSVAQEGLALVE